MTCFAGSPGRSRGGYRYDRSAPGVLRARCWTREDIRLRKLLLCCLLFAGCPTGKTAPRRCPGLYEQRFSTGAGQRRGVSIRGKEHLSLDSGNRARLVRGSDVLSRRSGVSRPGRASTRNLDPPVIIESARRSTAADRDKCHAPSAGSISSLAGARTTGSRLRKTIR